MSESTNRAPTPPSITARKRRFTGAHPYPALPRSRLPLLRGVLWVTWAAALAIIDAARAALRGASRRSRNAPSAPAPARRAPRIPSLTPTG